MTEQEQQIALCEWAGWKRHCVGATWGWQNIETNTVSARLPDTNSLDVLHSFAMKIKAMPGMEWTHYNETLLKLCNGYKWDAANATPEQRRKAMLITLNLWREDSNEVGK